MDKRTIKLIILAILASLLNYTLVAQTNSETNLLEAMPIPDRMVVFNLSDSGVAKPITWGLDLAWLSETNMKRGIAFMGSERVDVVRSSFTPTAPLVNGTLPALELGRLNERLAIIGLLGRNMNLVLNCDHPSVDSWYEGNASRWAQLIDVTVQLHEAQGHTVVTVSPFNEPDYGWGQGTMADFYAICGELRNNPRFNDIRISGGNTLSTDAAMEWYTYLKNRLDEGNTHQLSGSFNSYATFHETVEADGNYGTNDELHNVMEAMVGVEYGMNTGIWWGTAELARGEFVKASHGKRLAYAEHRPNWTAASVYRGPSGKVQAFGGASERQATTTVYNFISKDRDVYYDGYGPQREFSLEMPGGTGYQADQPNAERVINITWGDDIQPAINGQYILVNRNSGKVLEVANGSTAAGANVQQGTYAGASYQQWNVVPVSSRIVGDFSYFTITAKHSGKAPDVRDWSLENGADIIAWNDTKGANQQWYLDYAEDGWFYIRNRQSAKCLEIRDASSADGANAIQWEKNEGENQQWRFLPISSQVEFEAPNAPQNVVAVGNAESVLLSWSANSETDLAGYTIFRASEADGPFNTIARNVQGTSFVDNRTTTSGTYFYKVKAADRSLNTSGFSNEATATVTDNKALVAHYQFEGNGEDNSLNHNHGAYFGNTSYTAGQSGGEALSLNGSNAFVKLPPTIANQQEITIATWVYWNGGNIWQRIFDFGNGEPANMFLTPRSNTDELRFAIKNGGDEQRLNTSVLPTNQWVHVAVTLSAEKGSLYVNGNLADESTNISISANNIKPVLNFIGRSQYPDPLFNGRVDDFMIYNFALTADEISWLHRNGPLELTPDCNNQIGGGAFIDECGNCVGGNTGNTACATLELTLQEGWNLISLNVTADNMDINSIFPNAVIVKNTTRFYDKTIPSAFHSLSEITAGEGYLIYNSTNEVISITGTPIDESLQIPSTEEGQWKIIGCAWQEPISIVEALSNSTESIQVIKNFDGAWEQNGEQSLDSLEPGKGYFVR